MKHLVSIVIPAYNAVKRIEKALLSIAAQDYANIEIIVVDDASTDGTGGAAEKVLEGLGRAFKTIRHYTNKGVSAARNSGLDAVSGEYVIFFDADDMARRDFVSVLLSTITENDSDAAFCGYIDRFEDSGKERMVPVKLSPSRKYSPEELTAMYIFNQITPSICTAIFKTNFLKTLGLKFSAGCGFGEDMEFLVKSLLRCGSVNFAAGCHYIYIHHKEQVSQTMHQTPEKYLSRYSDNAEAVCRAARYVAEHAESAGVRGAGRNFMLTDGLIKIMNLAARRHDKTKFYDTLRDPETRRALKACLRYIIRKPELVLKAIALLTAPESYYRMRSKWK